MLRNECKNVKLNRVARALRTDVSNTELEVEKILYERMVRMLIECRRRNSQTTNTTTTATTTSTTAATITTSSPPQLQKCRSALNLTEAWRQDHNGSRIIPNGSQACDTRTMVSHGRPWFRFTAAAGSMLLNRCPPAYSCGTNAPLWSNDTMPSVVGVVSNISVYGSWGGNCKHSTLLVSVMRCSDETPNDFIYSYFDSFIGCNYAFCGMNKFV